MNFNEGHCSSKIFYLFHDVHMRNSVSCDTAEAGRVMNIAEFMEHVVKESPYTIDFVLETYDMAMPFRGEKKCYLDDLRAKFSGCFSGERSKWCAFKDAPARFHYNDVRQRYTAQLAQMASYYNDLFRWEREDRFDVVAAYEILVPAWNTLPEWKAELLEAYKVNKQLSLCTPDVRRIIEEWLSARIAAVEEELTRDLTGFHDFMQRLKEAAEVQKLHGSITFTQLQHVRGHLPTRFSLNMVMGGHLRFTVLIMDAYTVARMFRTFIRRGDASEPLRHDNAPMRNVFVYTGATHSENYVELLHALGCTRDVEVVNAAPIIADSDDILTMVRLYDAWSQCIDVDVFKPWPLVNTNTDVPGSTCAPPLTPCVSILDREDYAVFRAAYGVL
jgi:hypothetical protein